MPSKINSTTRLNRAALDQARGAFVDAMAELGAQTIATAEPNVPDATPIGVGLVTTGDWGVWVGGRKVAGTARKPRGARLKKGIALLVGYDFPGRFLETGTVKMAAEPFLTPAMMATLPRKDGFFKRAMSRFR